MAEVFFQYKSPLGPLIIRSDGKNLTGLWIDGQKNIPSGIVVNDLCDSVIHLVCSWLDAYFSGTSPGIAGLPILPEGTEFQKSVWGLLCRIPYGQTVTYGQIADKIAQERGLKRMSAQAVGQAVGANPIAIIIPCHRVVGAKGDLTGYAGGIKNKIWLLKHERVLI